MRAFLGGVIRRLLILPRFLFPCGAAQQDGCDLVEFDSLESIVGIRHDKIEALIHFGSDLLDLFRADPVRIVDLKLPTNTDPEIVKDVSLLRNESDSQRARCTAGTDFHKKPFLTCGQGVPGRDITVSVRFNPSYNGDVQAQMDLLVRYVSEDVLNCPSEKRKRFLFWWIRVE